MISGLNSIFQPYITKILLENQLSESPPQAGFVDLHSQCPDGAQCGEGNWLQEKGGPSATKEKVQVTVDVVIKAIFPSYTLGPSGVLNYPQNYELMRKLLINTNLIMFKVTDLVLYKAFLLSNDKWNFIEKNQLKFPPPAGPHSFIPVDSVDCGYLGLNGKSLDKYVYYNDGKHIINIPASMKTWITPEPDEPVPSFLAYVVVAGPISSKILDTGFLGWSFNSCLHRNVFASEILFSGGKVPKESSYFEIADTYIKNGKQFVGSAGNKYGAPGTVWAGPVHNHVHGDEYKFMAGDTHDMDTAHPFVNIVTRPNNKILDFRMLGEMETMFTYKSSKYAKFLASIKKTVYSDKAGLKNTIDEYNSKKAVCSTLDYSLSVLVAPDASRAGKIEKGAVNMFFAVDLVQLLKNNTSLPGLLDKLTTINPNFLKYFLKKIDFFHVEVQRVNVRSGRQETLCVSNNDSYFDDSGKTDNNGNSISLGHRFRKMNSLLHIPNYNNTTVNYYEFRDASINTMNMTHHGPAVNPPAAMPSAMAPGSQSLTFNETENRYMYKLVLKFKDPLVDYLQTQRRNAENILKDLDELSRKVNSKIYDVTANKNETTYDKNIINNPDGTNSLENTQVVNLSKMVDAYNVFYDKLNPIFIMHATNPASNFLTFKIVENMPESIYNNFGEYADVGFFPGTGLSYAGQIDEENIEDLAAMLYGFVDYNETEPIKNYNLNWDISSAAAFIRNLVNLNTTNPSRLIQARNIISTLHNKIVKALSLFGAPTTYVTIKDSFGSSTNATIQKTAGINYADYVKSQGNCQNSKDLVTIEYHNTFSEILDLEKYRNFFDWFDTKEQNDQNNSIALTPLNLRVVRGAKYDGLVKAAVTKNINTGFQPIIQSALPYSFVPHTSKRNINLFNRRTPLGFHDTWQVPGTAPPDQDPIGTYDFREKSYQSMRKDLFDKHTHKLRNITIPEILSYFGIKFKNGWKPKSKWVPETEKMGVPVGATTAKKGSKSGPKGGANPGFSDDIGEGFIEIPQDKIGVVGVNPGYWDKDSGGATNSDPDYGWQGSPYSLYPLITAEKIINYIFSDLLYNNRDATYKNKTYPEIEPALQTPVPFDENYPITMNLLRVALNMSNIFSNPEPLDLSIHLTPAVWENLFRDSGELKVENYQDFISLMCLFGKVEYFTGFQQTAPNNDSSPTSYYYNDIIKSKQWTPVTKNSFYDMPHNKVLYCRIKLFEGNSPGAIDKRFIKMFAKYSNYNEYFYLTRFPGTPTGGPNTGRIDTEQGRIDYDELYPGEVDGYRIPIAPDDRRGPAEDIGRNIGSEGAPGRSGPGVAPVPPNARPGATSSAPRGQPVGISAPAYTGQQFAVPTSVLPPVGAVDTASTTVVRGGSPTRGGNPSRY